MVIVWDPANDAAAKSYLELSHAQDFNVTCVAALPDGRVVTGSTGLRPSTRVWTLGAASHECTYAVVGRVNVGVTCVAALPDGRVVVGYHDGMVRVWNSTLTSCVVLNPATTHMRTRVLVLNAQQPPDEWRVAVEYKYDDCVRVWNPTTGELTTTIKVTSTAAAFMTGTHAATALAGGRRIVTSTADGLRAHVHDTRTGKRISTLGGHAGSRKFALSIVELPDGRVVTASIGDCTARVWNADTGECLAVLRDDAAAASPLMRMFVMSGGRLVIMSLESMNVWNVNANANANANAYTCESKSKLPGNVTGALVVGECVIVRHPGKVCTWQ
jgi:hypothetical protein